MARVRGQDGARVRGGPDGRPDWLGESAKCKANVRFLQIADQNRPQTDHYLQKSHRTRGISAAPHPGDGNRTRASAQPSARIYARPHRTPKPAPHPAKTTQYPQPRTRPSPSTKNRPPRAVHNAPHANGRKSGNKKLAGRSCSNFEQGRRLTCRRSACRGSRKPCLSDRQPCPRRSPWRR